MDDGYINKLICMFFSHLPLHLLEYGIIEYDIPTVAMASQPTTTIPVDYNDQTDLVSVNRNSQLNDDFTNQVTMLRNQMNSLAMKNFLFNDNVSAEVEPELRNNQLQPADADKDIYENVTVSRYSITDPKETPVLMRKTGEVKHRNEDERYKSGSVNLDDINVALSNENLSESKTSSSNVETDEMSKNVALPSIVIDKKVKPGVKFEIDETDSARSSYEVAAINAMPWQKKHQYRQVTPAFKEPKQLQKNFPQITENRLISGSNFKPIIMSNSTDNLLLSSQKLDQNNSQLLRPIPVFASHSIQDLRTIDSLEETRNEPMLFPSKSTDDLVFHDIDGIRKSIRSLTNYRKMKNRAHGSQNDLHESSNKTDRNLNVHYINNKKPLPLPRTKSNEFGIPAPAIVTASSEKPNESKNAVVYVIDKEINEFVLESEYEAKIKQKEENPTIKSPIKTKFPVIGANNNTDEQKLVKHRIVGNNKGRDDDETFYENIVYRTKSDYVNPNYYHSTPLEKIIEINNDCKSN